ncbi:predicted protein [Uncinocarpus reesii 1704]|uniref:Uncharacterized protein n=1 Tax=Uncinocarpus reesii (strain UAMH 1704) TaxID=336963 RepID=C4JY39_UNCRE|nr:uncharacterized protein UREG_07090 [Uncinocarpus reesii 1704]EEP82225.1 predicted protein [Uncinocarpus reesii 1704]
MAPPGRRRGGSVPSLLYLLSTIVLSALIASFPSTASAAGTGVIGIDLGTEYIKAAVVKPGVPLEIVLTKDSKRKELSAVAFKPAREKGPAFPERFYGSDAIALAPRFPEDVYPNLKSLLGVPFETGIQGSDGGEQNMVALYKERYPRVKLEPAADGRGTVGITSKRLGKPPFLVEELLAMQLKQIKANAEETGAQRTNLEDAVITVPPFFSAEEKRSVQLAAELAGLNVLSLLSDGVSVALNYATSRKFPNITNGEKPEHHIVFDMGAGSTSATVLKFQSRTVKDFGKYTRNLQEVHAVGVGWDKTLGGDALNQLIVNDMVAKLAESKTFKNRATPEQIKAHGKTMAKLWKESERLRQILSANTETAASFEGLYEDDVNFKYTITRATFEDLAKSHADRISKPLTDALEMAKLSLDDVESIILHGGVIRTPFVQKQIEQFCNGANKIRTNVNADEAAALGAGFRGAALSRAFRVKDIKTYDIPGYSASIRYVTGENVTIWFGMHLNPVNAVPEITRGSASCEVEEEVKKSVVDKAKEFLGFDSKKGQQPLKDDSSKDQASESSESSASQASSATPSTEDATSSTLSSSTDSAAEQASPPAKPWTTRSRARATREISGSRAQSLPSPEEMLRIKARLRAFDASDSARVQREEALNSLEAFIYRARELLDDTEFGGAIGKIAMEKLTQSLPEVADWLYGEGSDASTKELKAKLDSLKALVDPALNRKTENAMRPSKIESLKQSLKSAKTFVEAMEKQIKAEESAFSASSSKATSSSSSESSSASSASDSSASTTSSSTSSEPTPSYSMYSPIDVTTLSEIHDKIETWLNEKLKLQEKLAESDDPAITVADMEAKGAELQRTLNKVVEQIARKSKPGNGNGKKQGKKNGGSKDDKGKEKDKSKVKPKADKEKKEKKETNKGSDKKTASSSMKDEL